MLISAEVRWFWPGSPPPDLETHFRGGAIAPGGGGEPRPDEYVIDPDQRELGIKIRPGRPGIEIKGLVEVRERLARPFEGRVQVWSKWTSKALTIDHLPRVVVKKRRWLRKFDTSESTIRELALDADERLLDASAPLPDQGCHVELVDVRVGHELEQWSTFGFEAFGPLDTVERSLYRTAAAMPAPGAGTFTQALEMSYPEWLASLCAKKRD